MYTVNGEVFNSYMAAVKKATEVNADVIQADNGIRRWTPPAPVSKAKLRRYKDGMAAYDAQEKAKRR